MSPLYVREFHHWMRLQVRKHRQLLRWSSDGHKVRASMIKRFEWEFRLAWAPESWRACGPTHITAYAGPPYGGAGVILRADGVTGWGQAYSGSVTVYVAHDDRDLAVPLLHRLCNDNSLRVPTYGNIHYAERRLHLPHGGVALMVGPEEPWRPQHMRRPEPGEWDCQKTPWRSTLDVGCGI